jgi:hypothetical protein
MHCTALAAPLAPSLARRAALPRWGTPEDAKEKREKKGKKGKKEKLCDTGYPYSRRGP